MKSGIESLVVLLTACALSCGGSQSPAEPPPAAEQTAPPAEEPAPAARPEVTAEECENTGGSVVGDIGDGAVHRPNYRCPGGKQPSGTIKASAGGPVAVEGAVCCPK